MAKHTTELDDNGRLVTYPSTRSRRKSEERLIGWTAGPQNRRQRIARALWG